ncbi:MAG: tetratricopeptide repeat protein, partial [Deltaproteobacteria bacterium]|nr:tetratricopeptide repeat protein [Deltaproteobacteria bacterium]
EIARLLLFPITLSPDYNFNQIPIPRGFEPAVAAGAAVLGISLFIALRAWAVPRRFAMAAWAALTYFPISNLLVPVPLLLAERTLYIPSIALAVLAGDWLAGGIVRRRVGTRRLAVALAVVIVVLWGARTVARNPVWHDQLSLFTAAAEASPNSSVMRLSYGKELMKLGHTEEAIAEMEAAVRIQPELARAHYDLSIAYQAQNEPEKAEQAIRNLLYFRPDRPTPWLQLGRVLMMQGRMGDAAEALRRSLALNPRNEEARALLDDIQGNKQGNKP